MGGRRQRLCRKVALTVAPLGSCPDVRRAVGRRPALQFRSVTTHSVRVDIDGALIEAFHSGWYV
jgi:hypothetical protein